MAPISGSSTQMTTKVCFVSSYIYPLLFECSQQIIGGAEVQQYHIAKGLLEKGYSVSFVTGDFGQKQLEYWKDSPVYQTRRENGRFATIKNLHPNGTSILSALKMASADIYYQRGQSFLTGLVGFHNRMNNCKFFFSVTSLMDTTPPLIIYPLRRMNYNFSIKSTDLTISQTNEQKGIMAQNFGLDCKLIKTGLPAPRSRKKKHDKPYAIWVGRLVDYKRPWLFADLAEALPEHRFVMVGPASSEPSIKKTLGRIKNIENLDYKGFIPYDDNAELIRRSSVLVNTSIDEGFPNTFIQAWMYGVPTVSHVFDPDDVTVIPMSRYGWAIMQESMP